MKLTFEQIKSITHGAARIEHTDGKMKFYRFTDEQQEVYKLSGNDDFYNKTFAAAGIRFEFITNSTSLTLKADVSQSSRRTKFSHDVYANGEHRLSVSSDLASVADRRMTVEGTCALGSGKKLVSVYLPWSTCSELISLELDNGSSLTPVTHSRKMLCFGDSITQGYFADNSALSYANILADKLDAEVINKGIGGEIFRPALAKCADTFTPDIITVAYGTNDWFNRPKDAFDRDCEQFYKNLSTLYPTSKIFALAPIWRGDRTGSTCVGEFSYVAQKIKCAVDSIFNVTFIDCFEFVPALPEMFSPDMLHPCDLGFEHYAKNLLETMKPYLD